MAPSNRTGDHFRGIAAFRAVSIDGSHHIVISQSVRDGVIDVVFVVAVGPVVGIDIGKQSVGAAGGVGTVDLVRGHGIVGGEHWPGGKLIPPVAVIQRSLHRPDSLRCSATLIVTSVESGLQRRSCEDAYGQVPSEGDNPVEAIARHQINRYRIGRIDLRHSQVRVHGAPRTRDIGDIHLGLGESVVSAVGRAGSIKSGVGRGPGEGVA